MRYIIYLPEAAEQYQEGGRWFAPHPALAVFRETNAPDDKLEILPYGKHKGYSLMTFRTVEDACYCNTGVYIVKGRRFDIHEWTKKDGIGAKIVLVPKEVFYGHGED